MIVTQVQCDELAATMGSPIAVLGTSAQLFSNAPFFLQVSWDMAACCGPG